MATNEGWPEAFGFTLSHGSPCVVSWLEEGGSAQGAGLQCGDVLVEVDGEDVRDWSVVDVIERARIAEKVPPSLLVKSAVLLISLPRNPINRSFGVSFRGDCPVYIRSVDFDTVAWESGLRSGDLLIEVNSINVRYSSKSDVFQLLRNTGSVLTMTVVRGGLQNETVPVGERGMKNKAKLFNDKVNYFFQHDNHKRVQLLAILKLYNKTRDVEELGTSVDVLLETPIERRLLRDIRGFLLPNHLPRFDALVCFEPNRALSMIHRGLSPSPLNERSLARSRSGSLPTISDEAARLVVVSRDPSGAYGFSLSGNAPVFIRSVDTASPAAIAGLVPKDFILEINGIDVRNGTHSHVLRLLKKGGATPSLLVSQQPPIWGNALSHQMGEGRSSTHLLPETKIDSSSFERQSKLFKRQMDQLLAKDEQNFVTSELKRYSQQRDLPELVDGLSNVVSDKRKSAIFHYVCQMLPEGSQSRFDDLAATKLARSMDGPHRNPVSSLVTSSHRQQHRYNDSDSDHSSSYRGDGNDYIMNTSSSTDGSEEGVVLRHKKKSSKKSSRVGKSDDTVKGSTKKRKDSMATRPLPPIPSADTPPGSPFGGYETVKTKQAKEKVLSRKTKPSTAAAPPPSNKEPPVSPNITFSFPPPPPPSTPQGGVGAPPPPPPPAPPPPPPAVGGIKGVGRPKTKKVNWDRVQGQKLEGTIWRELSGLEEALEYCELEEQFSTVPTKTTESDNKSKNKKPSVLEPRKAYNIAILMGHLKMPPEQVKAAVLSCDTDVLSDARLTQMEAFAPDKRECLAFAKYCKDSSVLGPEDQFLCEMSTIPCYSERLRAMIYKSHFDERYEEIKSDLQMIVSASLCLQNSKKLKKILEIVLKIGNFLNVGVSQAPSTAAQGFKIHFLAQLKSLKTTDNKSTLIHYLYNTLEQKYPDILHFTAELELVKNAARVSGETLELEVGEVKEGLMEVKHTLNDIAIVENQLPNDKFIEVMKPFVKESESKISDLVRSYSEMRIHFNRVAKFFSEDPSQCQIDEFFGVFATFFTDFEKVERDTKIEKEREAQKQRNMEERARWSRRGSSGMVDMATEQDSVVDLRGELARLVASRNSQVSPQDETTPTTDETSVLYDKETFF